METNSGNLSEVSKNITTIEELWNKILNDPDKSESFHKFIESKYGLESKWEILNVTQLELEWLKKELEWGKQDFDNIWKKVYEEYLETSLETKWLKSIDLDILTQWEESSRLLDIKNQFEYYFDEKFSKYDFISNSQKELFKISIANKLINSQALWMWENIVWGFEKTVTNVSEKLVKWEYSQAIDQISNTKDIKKSWDILTQALNSNMEVYISKFNSIQLYIQENHSDLNSNQLQNIFSNIESFKNPKYLENQFETFDIKSVDFTKIDTFNSNVNVDNLKEYILQSKDNIHEKAKMLSKWDKVQEMVLDLIWDENFWWAMKWFLGFLMDLPVIWNLVSTFLWLNQNDPMWSLEKLSWKYNFFEWLISQWKDSDKQGKWVFKNIDFWIQEFQENKGVIEDIMNQLPQLDWKWINKFWQDWFSEKWYELKWVNIKFQGLDNPDNYTNWVLKQWVLNDILQKAMVKYENDIWALEIKQQQLEQSKADKIKADKINSLENNKGVLNEEIRNKNNKITLLWNILNYSEMSNVDDWDEWFNVWDITDIPILDIKNTKSSQDALKLIESNIWDKIAESNKEQILELSDLIIEYLSTNNLDNSIKSIWDLYDYSSDKSKWFFDFVSWRIQSNKSELAKLIVEEKKISTELEKLWIEKTLEEKIASSLLSINEWNLSDTINFWEYDMKYNSHNWELMVWDLKYIIYFWENIDNNFSNIVVNKWTIDFSIYWQTASVNKASVIKFLSESIINKWDKNVFESWNHKITLKKQAA